MNERLKFVIGQKRRLLNEIASRCADFKREGKNLNVNLTLSAYGNIVVPEGFVFEYLPVTREEYAKLTAKKKQVYDEHYRTTAMFLIEQYNEANKRYRDLFDKLDDYDKIDVLREELATLKQEQKRANIYFATLSRQSAERKQEELGANIELSEKQIVDINEEITQIRYINAMISQKEKLVEKIKEQL